MRCSNFTYREYLAPCQSCQGTDDVITIFLIVSDYDYLLGTYTLFIQELDETIIEFQENLYRILDE